MSLLNLSGTPAPPPRPAAQAHDAWHQDCLSLTVILASSFGPKAMKKLLARAERPAEDQQRPEALLHELHIACHRDPALVETITRELNARFRSSLHKIRAMNAHQAERSVDGWNWRLPPMWACFQHPDAQVRAIGRRLAHELVWQGMGRLREQRRVDEQAVQLRRLAQENTALREELRELRQARPVAAPAAPPRQGLAAGRPEAAAEAARQTKAQLRELRERLDEAQAENQRLAGDLATWRALALSADHDAAPAVGPASAPAFHSAGENLEVVCQRSVLVGGDCQGCQLRGMKVAVIGGLERMENSYCEAVGKLGGQCSFHPGHIRGGCRRLRQVVGKADVVVFITSVNSHGALSAVKDECKKCGKPFCALARTGVASLEELLLGFAA